MTGVPPSPFIIPAQPVLRDRPPKGDGWIHEVKFDGYRVQLHKGGKDVAIYSRNGINFTSRFPAIASALAHMPTKSVIIDAEAVAYTEYRISLRSTAEERSRTTSAAGPSTSYVTTA